MAEVNQPQSSGTGSEREQIRILLVDDHPVFTEALAAALAGQPGLDVVATATTGEEGVARAEEVSPHVAVVDVNLPDIDGIEVARRLRRNTPKVRVLMLTATLDAHLLPQAMEAGASGFLLKQSNVDELVDAIARVHGGQVVIPQRTMSRLVAAPGPSPTNPLTPRETQVLALLAEGGDVLGIAKTLGISWHTVRSHVKNVLAKLDARSQLEAVSTAMRLGILSVPERDATDLE